MQPHRLLIVPAFAALLAFAQFRESGLAVLASRLELTTQPLLPARVYLFKNDRPFRLSPIDTVLPLRVDLFYRERPFHRNANNLDPSTLEVICQDISHFFLLKGAANFDLPAGKYRIEAYRGLFYKPFVEEFELSAGQATRITLKLDNWAGNEAAEYLSADDHIHLVRAPEDNPLFLRWLAAEDLSVANFLQLQRQMDAATQYGFGPAAEAKRPGHSIRSGHESRSALFGHVNLLGGRQILRPLSIGTEYSNGPETFPYPFVLFENGRKVGATVGFAHFDGSQKHSSLLMDLALNAIDFIEVFQFGVLHTERWYELLNAGFKVTGLAGSDFPVSVNRTANGPRYTPLLGPERSLVRARPGASAYEAWSAAIRRGEGIVTNGPLIDLKISGNRAIATASFYEPLEKLMIVVNGKPVVTATNGTRLEATAELPASGAAWVAAHAVREKLQAHTNPVYLRWDGAPIDRGARQRLAARWREEVAYYRTAPLVFPNDAERATFFDRAAQALAILEK